MWATHVLLWFIGQIFTKDEQLKERNYCQASMETLLYNTQQHNYRDDISVLTKRTRKKVKAVNKEPNSLLSYENVTSENRYDTLLVFLLYLTILKWNQDSVTTLKLK